MYILLIIFTVYLAKKYFELREGYADLFKADGFMTARLTEEVGIRRVVEMSCDYICTLSGAEKERAVRNLNQRFGIAIKLNSDGSVTRETVNKIAEIFSARNPRLPIDNATEN